MATILFAMAMGIPGAIVLVMLWQAISRLVDRLFHSQMGYVILVVLAVAMAGVVTLLIQDVKDSLSTMERFAW